MGSEVAPHGDGPLPPPPAPAAWLKERLGACRAVGAALVAEARNAAAGRASTDRNGFATSVPDVWRQYVYNKFRVQRELLRHLWAAAGVEGAFVGRQAALLRHVSNEYDELKRAKDLVARYDAHRVTPGMAESDAAAIAAGVSLSAADGSGSSGAPPTAAVVDARVQLIAYLNMLQAPLDTAVRANVPGHGLRI